MGRINNKCDGLDKWDLEASARAYANQCDERFTEIATKVAKSHYPDDDVEVVVDQDIEFYSCSGKPISFKVQVDGEDTFDYEFNADLTPWLIYAADTIRESATWSVEV